MTKVVRFAPSPTGFLHIGNARTALFNWFYARHHGGTFLLRIEDTDRARSTQAAIDAIVDGLSWLGITWDGDVIYQSTRLARHAEVAHRLLETGRAYRCYCTPEELADMRERAKAQGRPPRYDGRWRDRDPSEAPPGVAPVIRLKAPTTGDSVVLDGVQGEVRVGNEQLDDMVLLRGDGSPTYMLAVVVDDHDMGVTQVIRGSDHLTNTFRQIQIFDAMDWPIPAFAHIPLIHGPDGAKLSKRHGALGVDAYRDMGFLPEALRNYLLRLGWSHGDDEVFTTEQAIAWFDLDAVGRSPARFDLEKLTALNARYLREADDRYIADLVAQRVGEPGDPDGLRRLHQGIGGLRQRARTLVDLAESARIYTDGVEINVDDKARAVLDDANRAMVKELADRLELAASWTAADIEGTVRAFAEATGATLGAVAQPLRAAVTGRTVSPGIFDVMVVLGRSLTLARARRSVT